MLLVRRVLVNTAALAAIAGAAVAVVAGSAAEEPQSKASRSAADFLSSLGINIHIDQGYPAPSYVEPIKYLGVRAVRTGSRKPAASIYLSRETGVLVDIFENGGPIDTFLASARQLAEAGALLALEGPNEPNNFPLTYNGKQGGGMGSWMPVGEFQRDLYAAVKADPVLHAYPVISPSEPGAQTTDVGLQFLTIPEGADTRLPAGTRLADFANVHNYVIGNGWKYADNQAWNAADPVLNDRWDGIYGNFGVTWRNHFAGYAKDALLTLPRVTTETGWDSVKHPGGERTQGVVVINTYLAQYVQGYKYTFIYQLRDGEGGEDNYGLFDKDSRPKLAANYIRNLTTILADPSPSDKGAVDKGESLDYAISPKPDTVHDLLLHKGDGTFALVVWAESLKDTHNVAVKLGAKFSSAKVYDVTAGTSPIATLSNVKEIPLSLTDHALIIELKR